MTRTVLLGDYLDTLTDYHANGSYEVLKKNVSLKDTPDYAVMIRTTNFESNDFKIDLKYIDEHAYNFLSKSKIKAGDILMNKISGAGTVYRMPEINKRVSLAMNLFLLRTNSNELDQDYAFYYLRANEDYVKSRAAGTSTTTITKDSVRKLEIQKPPMLVQRKIAQILRSLDKKIELNNQSNEMLESVGQALYKYFFIDNQASKDWTVGKLENIIDVLSGFAFKRTDFRDDGKLSLVTIKNVQDGNFITKYKDHLGVAPLNMPDHCHIDNGDILLSLTGNVGRVCITYGDNLLLNQRLGKLRPKEKSDQAFAYFLFRQPRFKELLISMSRGTAQMNLSPVETKKMKMLNPDNNTLSNFSKVATPIFNKLLENFIETNYLVNLRNSLLPRLISGKIKV